MLLAAAGAAAARACARAAAHNRHDDPPAQSGTDLGRFALQIDHSCVPKCRAAPQSLYCLEHRPERAAVAPSHARLTVGPRGAHRRVPRTARTSPLQRSAPNKLRRPRRTPNGLLLPRPPIPTPHAGDLLALRSAAAADARREGRVLRRHDRLCASLRHCASTRARHRHAPPRVRTGAAIGAASRAGSRAP